MGRYIKNLTIAITALIMIVGISACAISPNGNTDGTCSYILSSCHKVDGRQGVAWEKGRYYVSGSTTLSVYNANWKRIKKQRNPFAGFDTQVNHIGDIDVYNGEIYAGVEYFMDGAASNIQMAVYDADTLKLSRTYPFEPASGQSEVSGIAVDPDHESIWMCSWGEDESCSYLYRYDLETGAYLGKVHMKEPPQLIQGIVYYDGWIYITADDGSADEDQPDHVYKCMVDPELDEFPVITEKTLDDVVRQGEIEGISFERDKKQMLVSYNRGAIIVKGMPKGFYDGYDIEIHEVFVYNMREPSQAQHLRLEREDWSGDVKTALNDLVSIYGIDGESPAEAPYAVFDFDNTSCIFDVEEQLIVYQLQVMAFEVKPEDLKRVLLTDLNDPEKDLTALGYGKGSLKDWIEDIGAAYAALWKSYGPFTAAGVPADKIDEMQKDPQWQEFSTKMRTLYSLVYDAQSASVAYPWITYWFTGMTEDEVYDLAAKCFTEYKDVDTSIVTWTSPASIKSKAGVVSCEWVSGIQVTENIKELWQTFADNGIDLWVCSASCTGAIRAAIDVFGLHDLCTGMIGMTNKMDESGRYIAAYDMETGCGYYAGKNGAWTRMTRPVKAQTQGPGKVTAIANAIAPEYKDQGPIAGFMDSTGDYNFCTEFETLKLVVCFNRADRKVTDGGGLIAETALYEKDTLGYDLAKANAAGDTLYVLQGRDENGKRTFRSSNATIRYGNEEETLLRNEDNEAQLQRMIDDNMTVADILNTFAIKQKAGKNGFDFDTGFLTEYAGYHTHK